jgi:hypothetical protein
LAFAVGYVVTIKSQHDSGIVWWYVVLVLAGAGLCLAAAAARWRAAGVGSLALLSAAAFLGILSIGVLLLPALAGIALSLGSLEQLRRPAGR